MREAGAEGSGARVGAGIIQSKNGMERLVGFIADPPPEEPEPIYGIVP